MTGATGPQTFKLGKSTRMGVGRILLQLGLGFIVWFLMSMILVAILEKAVGDVGASTVATVLIALFLLSGVIVVPLFVVLRGLLATELSLTLDSDTGLTVSQNRIQGGGQTKHYAWSDVSGTQMLGTTSAEGMVTNYTFHIYMSDGSELKAPTSMSSFAYFIDFMNRATTHLPYTWVKLDNEAARAIGSVAGWYQVSRDQSLK